MTTGPIDFWRFFDLRELARRTRETGVPLDDGSYSSDPILSRFHFCNVFREADAGTRFFQANSSPGPIPILWQSLCYRPVNRMATFKAWAEMLPHERKGPKVTAFPLPEETNEWIAFLRRRMKSGEKAFTGRHLTRGLNNYAEALRWLARDGAANLRAVHEEVERAGALEAVCDALKSVPYVGDFFAWQVCCDLVESGVVEDDGSWALLGPGARRGAQLVSVGSPMESATLGQRDALEVARWLVRTQRLYVGYLDREAALKGPAVKADHWLYFPVNLKTIEHALCEYVRYVRARENPRGAGLEVKPWAK